jgi:hypothetical protein
MVSSTFTDLVQHRKYLIKVLSENDLHAIAMENMPARSDVHVLESSLEMVREARAYICLISRKYGQVPKCSENPQELSLTELEFHEAQRLKLPLLLFIMGIKHQLTEEDVEVNCGKRRKLQAFRKKAMKFSPDSELQRVYEEFQSIDDFYADAASAVARLARKLTETPSERTQAPFPAHSETVLLATAPGTTEEQSLGPALPDSDPFATPSTSPTSRPESRDASKEAVRTIQTVFGLPESNMEVTTPEPPTLFAAPSYVASNLFVGRRAEIEILDDWSNSADPNPMFVLEAMGGAGKSFLAWEWMTRHSNERTDWAGRFWFSFYELGATLNEFSRQALAYVTRTPAASLNTRKPQEVMEQLLVQLSARPWLFVLDGLERILVAYQDTNAAELLDDAADNPIGPISNQDPRTAISPEDDDFLRELTLATPSRILITSRLFPRVLINPSDQPIPRVKRQTLGGLRPPDAEELLRSCGVVGDSVAIQTYLRTNCDCHPLTTGVIAGLIVHYLQAPGNFDRWSTDPDHGGNLNLANLNLIQRRTHIIKAAIDALSKESRQLLCTLALFCGSLDYETLIVLNPHLSAEPKQKTKPEGSGEVEGVQPTRNSMDPKRLLNQTVSDLQSRGLLQYDYLARRYDLHPVVRGVASGTLKPEEKQLFGGPIIDIFNAKPHNPWQVAQTLEDVEIGLELVRTLLNIGRFQQAADTLYDGLSAALFINLEAYVELLRLLMPFFPDGWQTLPTTVNQYMAATLASDASLALSELGSFDAASLACSASIRGNLSTERWREIYSNINNLANLLSPERKLQISDRLLKLSGEISSLSGDPEGSFLNLLDKFKLAYTIGDWATADTLWASLDPMGRSWHRNLYRSGTAESHYAWSRFYRGDLDEETILRAKRLAIEGNNRSFIRSLHSLHGLYYVNLAETSGPLGQKEWTLAAESFHQSVLMARAVGTTDAISETYFALAKQHLGQLEDGHAEAARLASLKRPDNFGLAKLYLALDDRTNAEKYALIAYEKAWHDGGRYVYRYWLDQAKALLDQLNVPIPNLEVLHPDTAPRFDWEDDVEAALAKLRAKKESKGTST